MIVTSLGDEAFLSRGPDLSRLDADLVEMTLLLPQEQVATLEEAAHDRGLTIGQMIRRLVRDFTSRQRFQAPDRVSRLANLGEPWAWSEEAQP
jgi:hypothetical protein